MFTEVSRSMNMGEEAWAPEARNYGEDSEGEGVEELKFPEANAEPMEEAGDEQVLKDYLLLHCSKTEFSLIDA